MNLEARSASPNLLPQSSWARDTLFPFLCNSQRPGKGLYHQGTNKKICFSSLPPPQGCCAMCHSLSHEKLLEEKHLRIHNSLLWMQSEVSRCVVLTPLSEKIRLTLERGQTKLWARPSTPEAPSLSHIWPQHGQGEWKWLKSEEDRVGRMGNMQTLSTYSMPSVLLISFNPHCRTAALRPQILNLSYFTDEETY